MRSIGCFADRLQQPFQHVQANHPEIILCDNGLSENHLCKIITFTKKSRLYIIVCDHIHRSPYIVYTIYIHIYLCLRITMNIFRGFIKFCLQKFTMPPLFISLPALPKKMGTLKGPKESSADSELLNFSLASVQQRRWAENPHADFSSKGSTFQPYQALAVCYGSQTQGTYRTAAGFEKKNLYQSWLTNAHRFARRDASGRCNGLRGSDLSCCKSQLVLALLGQWPFLQTLHLRLPVKSTCSNALYVTYLYV